MNAHDRLVKALDVCACNQGANQHGPWFHVSPYCPRHGDAVARTGAVLAVLPELLTDPDFTKLLADVLPARNGDVHWVLAAAAKALTEDSTA